VANPTSGARSKILLGIESTFGEAATLKYKLPFVDESLNANLESVRSEALLGYRGTKSLAPGREGTGGGITLELFPVPAGVLFYLALGLATLKDPDSTPDSGDEYTEITAVTSATGNLPSATIRVDHDGIIRDYLGMKLNTLTLEMAVGGIPRITTDWVGIQESDEVATEGSITEPSDDPFYFRELLLSADGTNWTADKYSRITLSIANNLDTDDYRLDGTGRRKTIPEGNLAITGDVELLLTTDTFSDQYNKFINFQDASLYLKFEKSTGEKLIIKLPRIKFASMTHDIGGPGRITLRGSYEALIPSTGQIITVEDYTNDTGTY